ncbi:hypothetical protein C8D88_11739 [Lentzea atacamensis]|uniref:Uncharacterized protein n=1 Tax=Lentzea atacamensis TaxID=531938 RepID=A0A316HJM0_9PSEU|nr:hypothetical protein [Lentzea atacamensis]PWK81417.1 hypothetical protein C8D88_11739 [Lentzea atacamensis]
MDHLSWRRAFYVNIPLGVAVVLVAIAALPTIKAGGHPKIDYAGLALIALAATGLTLVTSWGGTEYPWSSPTILWMAAGSIVLFVAFVFVEQRAAEPMLPMRLFRSRVFTVSGILSFVVGFAMLGGITYLPTYLQYVRRAAATGNSGVGESFAAPPSNSCDELRKLVSTVVAKSEEDPGLAVLRRSGVDLPLEQAWLLGRIYRAAADDGVATLDEITEMTEVPGGIFAPTARALVEAGHLAAHDDGYRFTGLGADVFTQLVRAWRRWLLDQLEDWHEPDQREFAEALDSFTDELIETGRRLSRV